MSEQHVDTMRRHESISVKSRAELLIVVSCKGYYQVMGMMLLVSQYGFAKLVPAGTPMQCHL